MDWATFTGYFDWWLFIAVLILILGGIVSYWHKFNVPILIGTVAISVLFAVWGSNFYAITMKPFVDYLRFGGSIGWHNYGSMIYFIGFLTVVSVAIINIFMSKRGDPRVWK